MGETLPIDTRALAAPVPARESRAFDRDVRAALPPRLKATPAGIVLLVMAIALPLLLVLNLGTGVFLDDGELDASMLVLFAPFALSVIVGAIIGVRAMVIRVRTRRRRWRLRAFALDNGWDYTPWSPAYTPGLAAAAPGAMVDVFDRMRAPSPTSFEAGRLRAETGSGRSRTVHLTDYAEIALEGTYPHIVLDARANDLVFGRSNLALDVARGQQLALEGDFPRHFRLYCPPGYERDALYLFTPDVMAVLVDHLADLDVEIIDDRLVLYSPDGIVTTAPERWRSLIAVTALLRERIASWERWRDDRLASTATAVAPRPRGVAREGRRLRPKSQAVWMIAAALLMLYTVWTIGSELIAWIGSLIR